MKILILAPEPFFSLRGSSIRLCHTMRALAEAGHKVELLCYPRGEHTEISGVQVFRVPSCPGLGLFAGRDMWCKFFMNAYMLLAAGRRLMRGGYDVVHVVQSSTWFAGCLKWIFRIKLVCDIYGPLRETLRDTTSILSRPFLPWKEALSRKTLRAADLIIARSAGMAISLGKDFSKVHIAQIEDAPLAASFQSDLEGADAFRKKYDVGHVPVILYAGGFDSAQGVDMFLRAAPRIRKGFPDVCFLLVGGLADQVAKMRKLAESLDILDNCLFTGKRPMSEVPAYMTAASVLVSPHLRTPYPVSKIFTYMQSGKPIVATRVAAHTEVLDETCAILVAQQADALAEGVLRALREPLLSKALGVEAMSRVAAQYGVSSFKHKLRVAYQAIA